MKQKEKTQRASAACLFATKLIYQDLRQANQLSADSI